MKIAAIVVLLALTTACQNISIDSGMYAPVGNTRSEGFDGDGLIFKLEVGSHKQWTPTLSGYCSWLHVSNVRSGPPFNNNEESFIQSFGCGGKWVIDLGHMPGRRR